MPNILYCEDGTTSTRDLSLYYGTSGGASTGSSVTTPVKSNSRSLKCADGQFSFTPAVMVNAGNRSVFWFQLDGLPAAGLLTTVFANVSSAGGSGSYGIRIDSNGKLNIGSSTNNKTGSTTLSINTWYRCAVAHIITSVSNFTVKAFITSADDTIQSVAEVTLTQADFNLANTNGNTAQLGANAGGASPPNSYFNSLYIDDGTTLDDPGDVRTNERQFNATSTNNWDTTSGSGSNRWDYVNDHPLSDTNFIKHAASAQQSEVFGIQDATQNDVNISGKTLLGYMAWYRSKIDAYVRGDRDLVTSKGTTSTTTTFPGTSTAATDDYVFVAFADQVGGSAPTVAKSSGTATIGTFNLLTTATSTVRLQCWYAKVTTGGTYTLQFTHTSSNAARVGICGLFSNLLTSSPLDKNPACTSDGTTAYDSANTGVLTQADALVLSVFAFAGPSTDTVALGTQTPSGLPQTLLHNGGTTGGSAATNVNMYVYYAPVQATTAVAAQVTETTSNRAGVQNIAVFKAAIPLIDGTPKLVSNGSDNAVVLTNSAAMYKVLTTTGSYPSGAFGMKSSGGMPTYFYEGGVIVAYTTGASTPSLIWRPNPMMQFLVR